jgi:beta-carotene 15,15'-dioxygenase
MSHPRIVQWMITVVCLMVYILATRSGISSDFIVWSAGLPMLLITGIPHGATDHLLHRFRHSGSIDGKVSISFIIDYLFKIAIYGLIWWFFPPLALVIFLMISAYHFGETHFQITENGPDQGLVKYLALGVLLLTTLFYFHLEVALDLLKGIVLLDGREDFLQKVLLMLMGLSMSWLVLISWFGRSWLTLFRILADYALLAVLFYFTDLLFGFLVFFTVWHSSDAILLQLKGMHSAQQPFTIKSFVRASLPFTLISVFGIAAILMALYQLNTQISLYTLFLIMISLLTLPHQWEVSRFYRHVG